MEREIFCDECGDCAIEVDAQAAGTDLDGIHCVCQACKVDGKIVYLDDGDEDGPYSWLKFRKLTEDEESELAALACDNVDELPDHCSISMSLRPGQGIGSAILEAMAAQGDEVAEEVLRDEVEIEVDRMFEPTDVSELALLLIRDGWLDK